MQLKFISAIALTTALMFSGCATSNTSATAAQAIATKPSDSVKSLIEKGKLEVVDFSYVRSKLGSGMRGNSEALFIDARPDRHYNAGTIPSSIQIHDTDFKDHVKRIDGTPKDKEIIVFCQGWDCAKSPKVAIMLKELGYKNVKLYQAGYPEWSKKDYIEVGTPTVKNAFDANSAFMIDARPYAKFLAESIPGAISITDTELDKLSGRFPSAKDTQIITFCQGYDCKKSHIVAQKLVSLGYTKVANYSAGVPAWKEAGLKTTKGGSEAAASGAVAKLSTPFMGPIKKGLDIGSVDGEWFLANYKKLPAGVTIVDVRRSDERATGFVPGSLHISIEENDEKTFLSKLPDTYVIFHCAAGGRALEAQSKAKKGGFTKGVYIDAAVKCKGSECTFTPNEPLDPSDW
ncbi:rhodanese-like domain-containing protein [Campylobacter sp. RM9344]|uniref:Rhodanese-like domain-containing protein n=1 Tax=Campylobacter californiensis TaxID=1032243 RepID=A0AAW3ZRG0_9BACT|nr:MULTISPECIES: rhodanese-like domain-containing protein [unclassified Campylobacter]MBE2983845.1 rhodanese-like domain-containing protein [Campylobacter sp. RM6883]MBE2994383.1 rhodanese-like domain-containing protein [Campylobacter sp. RM6913]MBE3028691.1 rhodanese-like domain-containing protein [Campylobacter sp. RM9344]MBE3607580.1 rhodanese-like domain-containing protein [Campylobacter sp. RM9337]QCD50974.1 putative rhodanese-related sulfurtransferase (multiple rhodanese domains) [Campyl